MTTSADQHHLASSMTPSTNHRLRLVLIVAGVLAALLSERIEIRYAEARPLDQVVGPHTSIGVCPDALTSGTDALAKALQDPAALYGHGLPCNPSLAPGPANLPRNSLSLANASRPYHPIFNRLVWKCGCR
jgi:hypothetical protein